MHHFLSVFFILEKEIRYVGMEYTNILCSCLSITILNFIASKLQKLHLICGQNVTRVKLCVTFLNYYMIYLLTLLTAPLLFKIFDGN